MARGVLTPQQLATKPGQPVTWTNIDTVNLHQVVNDGRTVVLVQTPAGGAVTLTFPSVACSHGRVGDIGPTVLGASVVESFGPFPDATLWGDGVNLFINPSAQTGVCLVAAVKL